MFSERIIEVELYMACTMYAIDVLGPCYNTPITWELFVMK